MLSQNEKAPPEDPAGRWLRCLVVEARDRATVPARRSRNDGAGGGARDGTSPFSLFPRGGRSQASPRRRCLAVGGALVGGAPRGAAGVDDDRVGVPERRPRRP